MQQYFGGEQLELAELQEDKSFFLVDEHVVNLFARELVETIKTVVPYPFRHHCSLHGPLVCDPLVALDVAENEQRLFLFGELNIVCRDEVEFET